ncbi:MAG: hypothetical protein AB8B84_08080 [Granulosicoccus sp.]
MEIGEIVVAALLVLNISVSIVIMRRVEFDKNQKIIQICLVWFLPLLGFILILFLYAGIRSSTADKKQFGGGPGETDVGGYASGEAGDGD